MFFKICLLVSLCLSLHSSNTNAELIKTKRATKSNNFKVSNTKVVVIGAGASGLAACSRLISNGIKNIVLIEANDRLGGRTNTVPFNDRHIEIGAQWIHGQVGNPVFNIMKSLNQIDPVITFPNTRVYYSTQDGTSLKDTYVERIQDDLDDLFSEISDEIDNASPSPKVSVGFYKERSFEEYLRSLSNPDERLVRAIYNGLLNDLRSDYAIDSFNDLGAVSYKEHIEFKGEKYTSLKNGYIKLIEYLSSNISLSSIKLNEEVKNIDWGNSNSQIQLRTLNLKTNSFKLYDADIVLVTSSLGFLKSNHKTLFSPNLPSDKIDAIESLGYGTMDKLFLVFDEPVFQNGEAGLKVFWKDDIEFLDSKYNLNGNKFYKGLNSFNVAPGMPNVLYAFLSGTEANYAENLSDSTLLGILYDILTQSFPELDLPRPKLIRSKWNNDTFAKGSYSYYKVGTTGDTVKALARPLNKKLFFAGEATSQSYMSTVHGAYISGVDAADIIFFSFTKQFVNKPFCIWIVN